MPLKNEISKIFSEALKKVSGECVPEEEILLSFETPREERFGDLSSNALMKLAKKMKTSPGALAEKVCKEFQALLGESGLKERVAQVSAVGGFINFSFSKKELQEVILRIHQENAHYGKPAALKKKNILLEFVSANPTGPLTVAHGRQAALGDSLARILSFCGHKVTKEYYNNDEGVQIETLGRSTQLWIRKKLFGENPEFPENFYRGDYLADTAARLIGVKSKELKSASEAEQIRLCSAFAKEDILKGIKKDLSDFGVGFDNFYSQEVLARSGKVEETLQALRAKGVVYESEGATWFRSTDFGDDKDRVLVKSDKSYTYLTPDIAYHHDKFARGFDELINIWGPDHHGYIARLKASQAALGRDASQIHILIAQLVTLYEGEKQVRMSTRAGEFVTLRQILDEVGKDAGRFFLLMRKFDAHLDFDLSLAKSQTPENPVFYIQYAHARVESIRAMCIEKDVHFSWENKVCLSSLEHPMELKLLRLLAGYEETVLAAERTLEPYRLVPYLMELASGFHRFYAENRVVNEDPKLTQARLMLVYSVQSVLKSGLALLGVSAPSKM